MRLVLLSTRTRARAHACMLTRAGGRVGWGGGPTGMHACLRCHVGGRAGGCYAVSPYVERRCACLRMCVSATLCVLAHARACVRAMCAGGRCPTTSSSWPPVTTLCAAKLLHGVCVIAPLVWPYCTVHVLVLPCLLVCSVSLFLSGMETEEWAKCRNITFRVQVLCLDLSAVCVLGAVPAVGRLLRLSVLRSPKTTP